MDVKLSLILIFCTIANANYVSTVLNKLLQEEECTHSWKKFAADSAATEFDGLEAGLFKPGIKAYVGRGIFDHQFVPGRFQTVEPTGLYHPSAWSIHRIIDTAEYLALNSSQIYEWVDSSYGNTVRNAVIPGYTPGRTVWYIARVQNNGFTYLGKVHGEWLFPSYGQGNANYENGNNQEISTNSYQVLTCRIEPKCDCILDIDFRNGKN